MEKSNLEQEANATILTYFYICSFIHTIGHFTQLLVHTEGLWKNLIYNNKPMLQYSIGTMLNCDLRIRRPEASNVYLGLCIYEICVRN